MMNEGQKNVIFALIALSLFLIWSNAQQSGKNLNWGLILLGYGLAFMLAFVVPTLILVILALTTLYVVYTMGIGSMRWLSEKLGTGGTNK